MAPTTTKVALVTGAAGGIGRVISLRLAEDGFDVALVQEIESKGRRSLAVPADISQEPEWRDLGSLDVMVANAGILVAVGSFLDITVESFDRLMAVNARGTMLCYKYAAKQMIAQGRGGRIIGACSLAGKRASKTIASYSATKFAVRALTQAAAQEFGEHGITVNAYAPGVVDTPMIDPLRATDGTSPLPLSTVLARTPVGRLGKPEDVAGLVSYLVSDGASFITGQSVGICGGTYFD
ncbi:hypothetical protein EI94DRAFT_1776776 [Lactarius quietus]|nr:hypothetical protein EI94DRAFT_1776776 [Lactarius quietus]